MSLKNYFALCVSLLVVLFGFSLECNASKLFEVKHKQHPRLYLDQSRVDQIRDAVNAPNAADSVLAQAWIDTERFAQSIARKLNEGKKPVSVVSDNPRRIIETASLLGLGHLMTEREEYSKAAAIYIKQLVAVNPRSLGGDYTQGGRIEAMGILYDWFFDELSSQQKYELSNAIRETIPLLSNYICGQNNRLNAAWRCEKMPPYPNALGGHSHQNNKEVLAGVLAIIDENPELMPLLDLEYENFAGPYNAIRAWVGIDGGYHMGWSYGSTYRSLDSIQLWLSATTGANLLRDWQGKTINYYIYGLRGDMSFPRGGDSFGKILDSPNMAAQALWAARYFDNAFAQDFYNRWIRPKQTYHRFEELFYWQPGIPSRPVEELELSRHFRNAGSVLMRDTWDFPNATLLEFKSTSFWSHNHHHLDQNSFTLFYKTPLLIDSGYYDNYNSPHWNNYYTRSIAHNLITIWDPSEEFSRSINDDWPCCSNDGGQKFMRISSPTLEQIKPGGENALDGIVAYKEGHTYSYARGNASRAYSAKKLDQSNGFVRDVVFLRNDSLASKPFVVIFDKITATKEGAQLNKRFLMHMVNEPTALNGVKQGAGIHKMAGPIAVVRNGGSILYSQTILPENAVLTKIGGHNEQRDYRFVVPSIESDMGYVLAGDQVGDNFDTRPQLSGNTNEEAGGWRIEVTASSPTQREYFLHVFSLADDRKQEPPSVENLSNKSVAAVNIGGKTIIVFNKHDSLDEPLKFSYQRAMHNILIVGLESSTRYEVNQQTEQDTHSTTILISPSETGQMLSDESGLLTIPIRDETLSFLSVEDGFIGTQ